METKLWKYFIFIFLLKHHSHVFDMSICKVCPSLIFVVVVVIIILNTYTRRVTNSMFKYIFMETKLWKYFIFIFLRGNMSILSTFI